MCLQEYVCPLPLTPAFRLQPGALPQRAPVSLICLSLRVFTHFVL